MRLIRSILRLFTICVRLCMSFGVVAIAAAPFIDTGTCMQRNLYGVTRRIVSLITNCTRLSSVEPKLTTQANYFASYSSKCGGRRNKGNYRQPNGNGSVYNKVSINKWKLTARFFRVHSHCVDAFLPLLARTPLFPFNFQQTKQTQRTKRKTPLALSVRTHTHKSYKLATAMSSPHRITMIQ